MHSIFRSNADKNNKIRVSRLKKQKDVGLSLDDESRCEILVG